MQAEEGKQGKQGKHYSRALQLLALRTNIEGRSVSTPADIQGAACALQAFANR